MATVSHLRLTCSPITAVSVQAHWPFSKALQELHLQALNLLGFPMDSAMYSIPLPWLQVPDQRQKRR